MSVSLPIHPFDKLLNDFLDDTMARWFYVTGRTQRIGLSIQLLGGVQESTPTREHLPNYTPEKMKPNFRNSFCRSVYSDITKTALCNKLDFYLKKKISQGKFDCLSCRCHKGVSNVLIPYNYPKDNSIIWYIYIGQFLLLKEKSVQVQKFAEQLLVKELNIIDIDDYSKIEEEEKSFLQPNVFIDPKDIGNEFQRSNIAQISFFDFLRFREFALARFQDFLDKVYGRDKTHSQQDSLELLKDYVDKKQRENEIISSMRNIVHLLIEIEKSHPGLFGTDKLENLKRKFDHGIADNIHSLSGSKTKMDMVFTKYEHNFSDRSSAMECINEINQL